jgi:NADH-quinone oxidoreductase subunit N
VLGVVNSVISAYYYLRVVATMWMREGEAADSPVCPALQVGVGLAALATVLLGLWPGPILTLAQAAARVLFGG